MSEERTREQPPRPARPVAPSPRRPPGWPAVALGVAAGFLVGVLFVVALGGAGAEPPRTRTVTVASRAPPLTGDETVITKTAVPDVVGERLDVARERIERAGFLVDEDDGGLFGSIVDSNWEVVEQDPAPETLLETGSSVRISLDRR